MLCQTWLQAYIDLKCLIALRQQDMLTLRWADFEGERIDSVIKKVSKKLRIAKTNEISEVLSRLPRNGEFLFPLENGELRDKNAFHSVWGRVMHEFIEAGGMRFTEHDIRGKVATDMDDPYHAQKLLGHSSIQMTEGYIKQRKNNVVQPHSRKK
jgi:integrase